MKFGDPSSECRDGGDQKMELMRKSGQKPSRGATANCSQEDQSQTFRGVGVPSPFEIKTISKWTSQMGLVKGAGVCRIPQDFR